MVWRSSNLIFRWLKEWFIYSFSFTNIFIKVKFIYTRLNLLFMPIDFFSGKPRQFQFNFSFFLTYIDGKLSWFWGMAVVETWSFFGEHFFFGASTVWEQDVVLENWLHECLVFRCVNCFAQKFLNLLWILFLRNCLTATIYFYLGFCRFLKLYILKEYEVLQSKIVLTFSTNK